MSEKSCILLGAPVQSGASQPGCLMGPSAYRTAGLKEVLVELGHEVTDRGDVAARLGAMATHKNPAIHDLEETASWIAALQDAAREAADTGDFPIFMGGDHSLSAGTVAGVAQAAAEADKPLFVLWLDAHPDIHTLDSTQSGNLHGTPVAYLTGQSGFEGHYPPLPHVINPKHVAMLGLRSVDAYERNALETAGIDAVDMRAIDEFGIAAPLRAFLDRVQAAGGRLHVSLDVDFLDPSIAPAVGTTVPGGATFREAHLVMEMLHDSGLVTSLDLVELNPFLDERGRTAKLMVDLTASLFGRKIFDRMTRSY